MITKTITNPLMLLTVALAVLITFGATSPAFAAPWAFAQADTSVRDRGHERPFTWVWNYWNTRAVITDIDPNSGPIGTTVELSGRNFNDESTIRFGRGVIDDVTVSDDGTKISFDVPESIDRYCTSRSRTCESNSSEVEAGKYAVRVQNGNRMSNGMRFEVTEENQDEPLSITKIDGPKALEVDTEGTWTVDVNAESDENLQYSVTWGDEASAMAMRMSSTAMTQSSATFTHTYTDEGTYTPIFTVTDRDGNTVTKEGHEVTVSTEIDETPHIDDAEPTSGAVRSTVTLTGSGFDAESEVLIGDVAAKTTVVDESEISFIVPVIDAGLHSITVRNDTGTSNAVSFTVTHPKGTVSVSGISAPSQLSINEEGTWTVHANSKLAGNLTYSVDWGEDASMMRSLRSNAVETQSSATFTHTYVNEGTYTPKFTVTDEIGNSASVKATVHVVVEE